MPIKAMFLSKVAGPEALGYGEIPPPRPAAGEALIKVFATAITPTALQWVPTWKRRTGEPRAFPLILSHEFSGIVEAVGPDTADLSPGEAIYGMNDWYAQAAVVPISALTAWQGLFDHARLKAGQRVLIHGAAGGVGVFAVQLAHWRGAHVIGTASTQNVEFVRQLGADEVTDYRTTRFETAARDMDVVFDAAGGATLERSWSVLKSGGRLVNIATQSQASADRRVGAAFLVM